MRLVRINNFIISWKKACYSHTCACMGIESANGVWRIFRAVSVEGRLRFLWLLFEEGEMSVVDLAAGARRTPSYASSQMKILFTAGLVQFRRTGMNVIYRAEADPKDFCSVELLRALERCCKQKVKFASIIRQVTAFTHERRIEIVRLLLEGGLSFNELIKHSGMTSSALSRHLTKLVAREVVRDDGEQYGLNDMPDPLGKALLNIVCGREKKCE